MQRIIAFEGIDGSGKTTVARIVAVELIKMGYKVTLSHEPYRVEISRLLEETAWKDPLALTFLFSGDRALHVNEVLKKNADFHIFDRYYCSTLAYQGALGLDLNWLLKVSSFFPKPFATFILDVPVEVGLKRVRRDSLAFKRKYESLNKVRELYLKIAPLCNGYVIDATKGVEDVVREVISLLTGLLSASSNARGPQEV